MNQGEPGNQCWRLTQLPSVARFNAFFCVFFANLVLCGINTAQEDFSGELPRIPASSPETALQKFKVADGFEIQPVASEPLVASPVAIEWDAEGRMYVCEMRGYSEDRDAGLSRIRRLEDTN